MCLRYWQDLGYLIVYVTGRPDMQKQRVVAWLSQHNFPHGVVSFCDGLVHDPLRHKANFLKCLVGEVGPRNRKPRGRGGRGCSALTLSLSLHALRPKCGSSPPTAPARTFRCMPTWASRRRISTSWEDPQRRCSTSVRYDEESKVFIRLSFAQRVGTASVPLSLGGGGLETEG